MCTGRCGELNTHKRLIAFLIINAFILCMGLVLIIIGALVLCDVSKINTENIKPLLDLFTVDSLQAVGMVKTLSIVLIVIGVLLFLVAVLSIVAAYFKKLYIIVLYANLVLVFLVMKFLIIGLWVTMETKVKTDMQGKMATGLKAHFADDTTTNSNSISNAWNYLFMTLHCCGVNPVVSTTNDFDETSWCTTSGSCQATSSQIPKTCCLNVDENTYTSAPVGCHASVNSGTYNTKGCYTVLKEKLLCYSTSIIWIVSITIVLEVAAVILAFFVCDEYEKHCPDRCLTLCKPSSIRSHEPFECLQPGNISTDAGQNRMTSFEGHHVQQQRKKSFEGHDAKKPFEGHHAQQQRKKSLEGHDAKKPFEGHHAQLQRKKSLEGHDAKKPFEGHHAQLQRKKSLVGHDAKKPFEGHHAQQ